MNSSPAMTSFKWTEWGWGLTLLILFTVLPIWTKDYQLYQLTMVLVYSVAIFGLNFLSGYNGQLSVGHGAFLGIGAYSCAIAINLFKIPYYFAIPLSAMICCLLGFLLGVPAVRLQRVSLSLTTFALAVSTPRIFEHFDSWTGGSMGMTVAKPLSDISLYYMSLGILIITFVSVAIVIKLRLGRAVRAVRDHEVAAESMGVNAAYYKIVSFSVSAMLTGAAGAVSALVVGHVAPESFGAELSVTLLIGLIVGGIGHLFGPVFGAIFILYLPNFTSPISKAFTSAVYGFILVLFIFASSEGIAGFFEKLQKRILNRIRRSPSI